MKISSRTWNTEMLIRIRQYIDRTVHVLLCIKAFLYQKAWQNDRKINRFLSQVMKILRFHSRQSCAKSKFLLFLLFSLLILLYWLFRFFLSSLKLEPLAALIYMWDLMALSIASHWQTEIRMEVFFIEIQLKMKNILKK